MKTLITSALVAAIAMGATAASAGTTYTKIVDPATNLVIGQEISNTETGEVVSVQSFANTAAQLFHHNQTREVYLTGGNGKELSLTAKTIARGIVAASEEVIDVQDAIISVTNAQIAERQAKIDNVENTLTDEERESMAARNARDAVEVEAAEEVVAAEKEVIAVEEERLSRKDRLTKDQKAKLKAVVAMYMANK